jgi:hypothetical protein
MAGSAAGLDPGQVQQSPPAGSGRPVGQSLLLINDPVPEPPAQTAAANGRPAKTARATSWQGVVVSAGVSSLDPPHSARMTPGVHAEPALNLPVSDDAWRRSRRKHSGHTAFRWALQSYAPQSARAYDRYVRFLEEHRTELQTMAGAHALAFRALVKKNEPDVANCLLLAGMARLYAGGMMALAAGVLPFTQAELGDALMACLVVARERTGYNTATLPGLQRRLRQHLHSNSIAGASRLKSTAPADKDGFWRTDGSEQRCTVTPRAFRKWFPIRAERTVLLHWLHRAGHLCLPTPPLRTPPPATK